MLCGIGKCKLSTVWYMLCLNNLTYQHKISFLIWKWEEHSFSCTINISSVHCRSLWALIHFQHLECHSGTYNYVSVKRKELKPLCWSDTILNFPRRDALSKLVSNDQEKTFCNNYPHSIQLVSSAYWKVPPC